MPVTFRFPIRPVPRYQRERGPVHHNVTAHPGSRGAVSRCGYADHAGWPVASTAMTPEPDRQQPDYPYPLIALWVVAAAAIIAGLASAGSAIDEQTSLGDPNPWPALLYQPLLILGSLSLVAALLGTALRR